MFHVYVIYDKVRKRNYIGVTNNIDRRLGEHIRGKTHITSRMKDLGLVYHEASLSKKDALLRERQFKTGFGRGYLKRRLKYWARGSVG